MSNKMPNDFLSNLVSTKSQKTRRKISLPWFRTNSSTPTSTLSRQHTIDSPGSFHLLRQSSNGLQVGGKTFSPDFCTKMKFFRFCAFIFDQLNNILFQFSV